MNHKAYQRWCQQHPDFNWQDYSQWVKNRGYYKSALDTSKPDFFDYVSLYLQLYKGRRNEVSR